MRQPLNTDTNIKTVVNKNCLEEAKKSGECFIVFDFEIDEYKDIRIKSFDNSGKIKFSVWDPQTESASKVISEILQQQNSSVLQELTKPNLMSSNKDWGLFPHKFKTQP